MAIKVQFSVGETSKRTAPLYQWDYGQQLEIESADLPTLIEVHFACPDMSEAIIRSCSVSNGIAAVTIPDRCLEQSNPITAWVYEINGSCGATTKAVVIPVTARTRPCRSAEIPQDVSDRYTELITEVNEAVGKLTKGEIMVASAAKATSADRATTAGNASTAAHAEQAAYATNAGAAVTASKDGMGRIIHETYQTKNKGGMQPMLYFSPVSGCVYMFKVVINGTPYYTTLFWTPNEGANMGLGFGNIGGVNYHFDLVKTPDNSLGVLGFRSFDGMGEVISNAEIFFCQI